LDKEKQQQELYKVLDCYQDVFAWNKGVPGLLHYRTFCCPCRFGQDEAQ
jgi:hypothetical protein